MYLVEVEDKEQKSQGVIRDSVISPTTTWDEFHSKKGERELLLQSVLGHLRNLQTFWWV